MLAFRTTDISTTALCGHVDLAMCTAGRTPLLHSWAQTSSRLITSAIPANFVAAANSFFCATDTNLPIDHNQWDRSRSTKMLSIALYIQKPYSSVSGGIGPSAWLMSARVNGCGAITKFYAYVKMAIFLQRNT